MNNDEKIDKIRKLIELYKEFREKTYLEFGYIEDKDLYETLSDLVKDVNKIIGGA
jgi:hypothetical protein